MGQTNGDKPYVIDLKKREKEKHGKMCHTVNILFHQMFHEKAYSWCTNLNLHPAGEDWGEV